MSGSILCIKSVIRTMETKNKKIKQTKEGNKMGNILAIAKIIGLTGPALYTTKREYDYRIKQLELFYNTPLQRDEKRRLGIETTLKGGFNKKQQSPWFSLHTKHEAERSLPLENKIEQRSPLENSETEIYLPLEDKLEINLPKEKEEKISLTKTMLKDSEGNVIFDVIKRYNIDENKIAEYRREFDSQLNIYHYTVLIDEDGKEIPGTRQDAK